MFKSLILGIALMGTSTAVLADGHLASEHGQETIVEHVVLFNFKDNVTQKQKLEVQERFEALEDSKKDGEPYILEIQSGFQNSKEGVSKGYELGFVVTFKNEMDRDYYVGKPFVTNGQYDMMHDAFKSFVGPMLEAKDGVLVFDFTSQAH